MEIVQKGKSLKESKYEDAVRLVRMEDVKKVDWGKFAKLRKKKVDKRLVMGWGEFYHYKQPKITELEVEPEVFVPGEDRLRITYMVEYQYPCDSVKVMIVNEKGRVVKTFESTQNELTTVEWDGRDDDGDIPPKKLSDAPVSDVPIDDTMSHRHIIPKRALLSVYDKRGIVDFARFLAERGIQIISTGGTARTLTKANIPLKEVSNYTGFPELMNGRVKTLHPKIHAGILALREEQTRIKNNAKTN